MLPALRPALDRRAAPRSSPPTRAAGSCWPPTSPRPRSPCPASATWSTPASPASPATATALKVQRLPDRGGLAGVGQPAGRPLRAGGRRHLHPPLLRGGLRRPPGVHRPRDPAHQPGVGHPPDDGHRPRRHRARSRSSTRPTAGPSPTASRLLEELGAARSGRATPRRALTASAAAWPACPSTPGSARMVLEAGGARLPPRGAGDRRRACRSRTPASAREDRDRRATSCTPASTTRRRTSSPTSTSGATCGSSSGSCRATGSAGCAAPSTSTSCASGSGRTCTASCARSPASSASTGSEERPRARRRAPGPARRPALPRRDEGPRATASTSAPATRVLVFPGSALAKAKAKPPLGDGRRAGRDQPPVRPHRRPRPPGVGRASWAPTSAKRTYGEPHWSYEDRGAAWPTSGSALRLGVWRPPGRPLAASTRPAPASCSSATPWWRATGQPTRRRRFARRNARRSPRSRRARPTPAGVTCSPTATPSGGLYDDRLPARSVRRRRPSTRGGRSTASPTPTCSRSPSTTSSTPMPGRSSARATTRTRGRREQGSLGRSRAPLSTVYEPGSPVDGVAVARPRRRAQPPSSRTASSGWCPATGTELVTALVRSLPKDLRRALGPVPDHVDGLPRRARPGRRAAASRCWLAPLTRAAGDGRRRRDRTSPPCPTTCASPTAVEVAGGGGVVRARTSPLSAPTSAREVRSRSATSSPVRRRRAAHRPHDLEHRPAAPQGHPEVDGHTVTAHPALVDEGAIGRGAGLRLARAGGRRPPGAGGAACSPRWASATWQGASRESPHQRAGRAGPRRAPTTRSDALLEESSSPCVDASIALAIEGAASGTRSFEDAALSVRDDQRRTAARRGAGGRPDIGRGGLRALELRLAGDVRPRPRRRGESSAARPRLPRLRAGIGPRPPPDVRALPQAITLVRLDKLPGRWPGRDADGHRPPVRPLRGRARAAAAGPATPVARVRWMIEELRVSLFAQSLGTRGSISEQRVRKALAGHRSAA